MVPNEETCPILKKIKKHMENSSAYQTYIEQVRTPLVRVWLPKKKFTDLERTPVLCLGCLKTTHGRECLIVCKPICVIIRLYRLVGSITFQH
jgi:hypothetical protein